MKFHVSHAAPRFVDARRALAAAVIATTAWAMYPASGRAELPGLAEVERAVIAADVASGSLKENWEPLLRFLGEVNQDTGEPVLRMMKGHIALAANHNNESVCLFMSVQVPEDKKRWLAWAEDFAVRHPDAPIVHYFHGDALARFGRWEEAIASLTRAIETLPDRPHALSSNARGVIRAYQTNFKLAIVDLDAAQGAAPEFADAFVSLANVYVQKRNGAKGAYRNFHTAVSHSNDFALALAGRGAMRTALKSQGYRNAAKRDFEQALKNSACQRPLIETIIARAALQTQDDEYREELFAIAPQGSSFYKDLMRTEASFMKNPTAETAGAYANNLAQLKQFNPTVYNKKMTELAVNPTLSNVGGFQNAVSQGLADNNPLGPNVGGVASILQDKSGGGVIGATIVGTGGQLGANAGIGRPDLFFDHKLNKIEGSFNTLQDMNSALNSNRSFNVSHPYGPQGPPVRMPEDSLNGGVSATFGHLSALDWPLDATYSLAYAPGADTCNLTEGED